MKKIILISISLCLLAGILYADEVEKLMKEVRLAYKELKKESKSMNEVALKDILEKMNALVEKMKKIKVEENQEKFNELTGKFSGKLSELDALIEHKNPEEFRKGIDELKNTCIKCHSTFMNPVKRFFLDLFL